MAKRRRLEPITLGEVSLPPDVERKAALPPLAPPIAQVAQDAAREAAFAEVSSAWAAARAEGRLVQKLPLDSVVLDHLLRDRAVIDAEGMETLVASLRVRGQQTPIEVVALADGRFGLISGWRRMLALRRLYRETGEERFASVLALLRQPRDAAEAYVAMVEENEIRLGLSHYERARIVARSVAAGVFPDRQAALRGLFGAGSRARRSKIGAFLTLVDALDGHLRFPAQIGERLGLALARQLEADPAFGPALAARLDRSALPTPEAERRILEAALRPAPAGAPDEAPAPETGPQTASETVLVAAPDPGADPAAVLTFEPAPGIRLEVRGGLLHPVLTLSGPRVDQPFRDRLLAWLRAQS